MCVLAAAFGRTRLAAAIGRPNPLVTLDPWVQQQLICQILVTLDPRCRLEMIFYATHTCVLTAAVGRPNPCNL